MVRDIAPCPGALDQFEALALNGRLRHGNHPVLSWCASNAIVTKDAAGNRKLDRSRATGRIDGLVAAVMAVPAMSGTPEAVKPSS
jgi:phage terminase large subunit-like protein